MNKTKGKKCCTLCKKFFDRKELTKNMHGLYCKNCLEKYKQMHHVPGSFGRGR